jgi:hypothetical protein
VLITHRTSAIAATKAAGDARRPGALFGPTNQVLAACRKTTKSSWPQRPSNRRRASRAAGGAAGGRSASPAAATSGTGVINGNHQI